MEKFHSIHMNFNTRGKWKKSSQNFQKKTKFVKTEIGKKVYWERLEKWGREMNIKKGLIMIKLSK